MSAPPLLELRGVHAAYGAIAALTDVSLQVAEGEIVTLIGANGSGKTTALMTVCGIVQASAGEVLLSGRPIQRLATAEIVRLGVVQVPEGRRIFPRLSVAENLEMGGFLRRDATGVRRDREGVYELFPVLAGRRHQPGGTLSGGEQQMLAIGRALMAAPRLLLLDEPSLGLAPLVVRQIFAVIGRMNREQGTTILLVEQNVQQALKVSSYAYVLETGKIALAGPSNDLLQEPRIKASYLGQ